MGNKLSPDEVMENAKQEAIRESMEGKDLQLAVHMTKDYYSDDELISTMVNFDEMWSKI